jgi:hypothetical protein
MVVWRDMNLVSTTVGGSTDSRDRTRIHVPSPFLLLHTALTVEPCGRKGEPTISLRGREKSGGHSLWIPAVDYRSVTARKKES